MTINNNPYKDSFPGVFDVLQDQFTQIVFDGPRDDEPADPDSPEWDKWHEDHLELAVIALLQTVFPDSQVTWHGKGYTITFMDPK